jgi:hypothetical protein
MNVFIAWYLVKQMDFTLIQGPFKKFVDWWQCAAVMQREVVTFMPSCSSGVM